MSNAKERETKTLATQRTRKREQTRERLFQAALAEFRRVGIAATRIEHIAARAKVVRGTFYFHFPSKEHVLKELRLRSQDALLQPLGAVDASRASLEALFDALAAGIEATLTLAADDNLMRDALSVYVREARDGPPMLERSRPVLVRTRAILKALAERGAVRDDLTPDQLARLTLLSAFSLYAGLRPSARANALGAWKRVMARGLATAAA